MTEKVITCITCPLGCAIIIKGQGEEIVSLVGNQCSRGEAYAKNEFIHPVRLLTTTLRVVGGQVPLVSVRSDRPIPKEKQTDCMEVIKQASAMAPVWRYDVLIADILGLGVNILATGEVER